jgi:hypothetical protein
LEFFKTATGSTSKNAGITPDRQRLLIGFAVHLQGRLAVIASVENPAIFEAGAPPRRQCVADAGPGRGSGAWRSWRRWMATVRSGDLEGGHSGCGSGAASPVRQRASFNCQVSEMQRIYLAVVKACQNRHRQ